MAQLNTRMIQKHDTEANWNKATNFIPKQGEIIIYDKDSSHDYVRMKVGDGSTKVTALAFVKPDASKTADKLATARSISVGGGTASFDGSNNISIPLTDVPNTALGWDITSSIYKTNAYDMTLESTMHANRLAYYPKEYIKAEYSQDGGQTWTEYTQDLKYQLTTDIGNGDYAGYSIGNKKNAEGATTKDLARFTFTGRTSSKSIFYGKIRKILICIQDKTAKNCKCLVEYSTAATPDNFVALCEGEISGNVGWNTVNLNAFYFGHPTYSNLRFTFSIGTPPASTSPEHGNLQIHKIKFFGETYYTVSGVDPIAITGYPFTMKLNKGVEFKGEVIAPNFTGLASKATSDSNGNNIANTYQKKTDSNPKYTYSTTDLTAGTSSLTTGALYFVYE